MVQAAVLEQIHLRAETLPPGQRIVYKLHYEERLSKEEIAQRLQRSIHTIDNHLARIKATLKNSINTKDLLLLVILLTVLKIF